MSYQGAVLATPSQPVRNARLRGPPPGLAAGLIVLAGVSSRPLRAAVPAEFPQGCGSSASFEGELRRRLESGVSLDTTRVTLTPEASGYRLVVEVGDERRELHDESCQELVRAAIVIALALLEPSAPTAAAPAPGALPDAAVSPSPKHSAAASASSAPARVLLGGGPGLHVGTTPQPTLLLDLDAQLEWSRAGLAFGLRYLLPSSTRDRANHGVRVGGVGAYLEGTFEPWRRVQGQLGLVAYRLAGSGLGSVEQSRDTAWTMGPILGASVTPYAQGAFWTRIGAEGQINSIRPDFRILDYGPVFRVPKVSASVFVRVGLVW
jgi:hypothetical protein